MEVKKLMIFKSRNLVNLILNFFKLYCCYRLKVSAYIFRVQSGIALLTETRVLKHVHHGFFAHFIAVTARLQRETS